MADLAGWFARQARKLAELVTATTVEKLRKALGEGRDVKEVFDEARNTRAKRIATTELGRAAQGASWVEAVDSGLFSKKTWNTQRDDRVRDEHEAMEGEEADIIQPFSNGLQFPQEPQCRCWLSYE